MNFVVRTYLYAVNTHLHALHTYIHSLCANVLCVVFLFVGTFRVIVTGETTIMLQHKDFSGHWLAIHDAKFEPLSAKVGCISHMHQCAFVHNMICCNKGGFDVQPLYEDNIKSPLLH